MQMINPTLKELKSSAKSKGIKEYYKMNKPQLYEVLKIEPKKREGPKKCPHDKLKYRCHECGGGGICMHNKVRYLCKICDGKGICVHRRQKFFCKDCGGSQICEHKKQRSECVNCGGSQICVHNKQKSNCKTCRKVSNLNIELKDMGQLLCD